MLSRLYKLIYKLKEDWFYTKFVAEDRSDLRWWISALENMDCYSLDWFLKSREHADLSVATDASGTKGFGALCSQPLQYFTASFTHLQEPNTVPWKELFAIVSAAHTWAPHWHNKVVLFQCDSQSVVNAIKRRYSPIPEIMTLLRNLFLHEIRFGYHLLVEHIPREFNKLADALSRGDLKAFHTLATKSRINVGSLCKPAYNY